VKLKLRSLFAHMDWIDWLLAAGFVICFSVIGIALVSFPYWLAFPVAGIVLIWLAKDRRDRMRNPPQGDEPPASKKP
jgi:hypothetical protein